MTSDYLLSVRVRVVLSFALLSALPLTLSGAALQTSGSGSRGIAPRPSVTEGAPPPRRAFAPADYLRWKTVRRSTLSDDGQWLGYEYGTMEDEDRLLVVRATHSAQEYRVPIGPGGLSQVAFSPDSKWFGALTPPLKQEAERLKAQGKPRQPSLVLLDLATGKETCDINIRAFAFANAATPIVALHRSAASSDSSANAPIPSDLVVRDLAAHTDVVLGSVAEFAFDKTGRRLAWTVDAPDGLGNGITLRDLTTGALTPLDSGRARYQQLTWSDAGDALAVLKTLGPKADAPRGYAVVAAAGLDSGPPQIVVYDPNGDASFPQDMMISPHRAPRWSEDRHALFFGIAAATGRGGETTASTGHTPTGQGAKPELMLWHWKDARIQPQQKFEEARDRRFSYLVTYRVNERKFLRLADESVREVKIPPTGPWAVGIDTRAYDLDASLDGRQYQDVYVVDVRTGERKRVAQHLRWLFAQSPDGVKLLAYENGHFLVIDAPSGKTKNLTQGLPVSFVDGRADEDAVSRPPTEPVGWTADSAGVLLTDGWDIWHVPVSGAPAVNLTKTGKRDQIRYSRARLDPQERGIDLAQAQYYSLLGAWTKAGGVARVSPGGGQPEILALDDASYRGLKKAVKGDLFLFTRETTTEPPDVYIADHSLKNARRITDMRAQLAEYYPMPEVRLVTYMSEAPPGGRSEKLQAALLLPANYEPGRKYPVIVYLYERLSNYLNRFLPPAPEMSVTTYRSNGYAVLLVDIRYIANDPGISALRCVLPALDAAIVTGTVDRSRVGLTGASWGGYQTVFLLTQTNAFRAAVAGAPITNLISLYGLVYKYYGITESSTFESGAIRMSGPYWEHWDAYVRNSPVFHATHINTPLLMYHNDNDGAVDFTQGVELFNVLRRLRKPVAMLQYVGENHTIDRPSNLLDYTLRVREFFDHYLKDAPAPDWWTAGVSRLDMDTHLKSRLFRTTPLSPPSPVSAATTATPRP